MESKLSEYIPYARYLSYKYPFYGSGADDEDVYQIAMIAAWDRMKENNSLEKRFVFRTMRLRVLDFVRKRPCDKQKVFNREFSTLNFDIKGGDSTLHSVLVNDELKRVIESINSLPKKQGFYLKQHIEGISHKDIDPSKKVQSIDVAIMKARRRVEADMAA